MTEPVRDLVAALEESLAAAKRKHALPASQPTDEDRPISLHEPRVAAEGFADDHELIPPTNGHTEDSGEPHPFAHSGEVFRSAPNEPQRKGPPVPGVAEWGVALTTTDGQGSTKPASDEWDRLAQLAEAATPGPWTTDEPRPSLIHTSGAIQIDEADWGQTDCNVYTLRTLDDDRAWSYADTRYVAAANPAAILRLIAERDEAIRLGQALADALTAVDVFSSVTPTSLREWREWQEARQ